VMGGEDWQMWIESLLNAGVLARGAKTTAFTYVGKTITQDIYWNGSIGMAKKDLDQKCRALRDRLSEVGGDARVSVLKAIVTQASSAIPTMPLYLSLLFKVMKSRGTHEGCIEQIQRLFSSRLYSNGAVALDDKGRIRVDDWEEYVGVDDGVVEGIASRCAVRIRGNTPKTPVGRRVPIGGRADPKIIDGQCRRRNNARSGRDQRRANKCPLLLLQDASASQELKISMTLPRFDRALHIEAT